MKEPIPPKSVRINPFTGESTGGQKGYDGYATMNEDELRTLEKNKYGIEEVYEVSDKLISSNENAMCANGGWFYVWEYTPDATVYFVPPGESDTFDAYEALEHIAIGKLAFGKSDSKYALMVTLSEDAMELLLRLGNIFETGDLIWTPLEQEM